MLAALRRPRYGYRLPLPLVSTGFDFDTIHHNELMEDWRLCQANQTPRRISPLQ
jgi:hypothetical protein